MHFSERLVSARKAKGLSQEALAEALGVSRQAVSKWETGESKPDLDNLIALCEKLELNIEYLCFGKEEQPQPEHKKESTKGWQIVIVTVVAIVCLTVGAFAGKTIFRQEDSPSAVQQWEQQVTPAEPDSNALLSQVEVVNVVFEYDYDSSSYRILVMPNSLPEGLTMELLIENTNIPDMADVTYRCSFEENYFTAILGPSVLPTYEYRITGILTLGDAKLQIPLALFHWDKESNGCGYTYLW